MFRKRTEHARPTARGSRPRRDPQLAREEALRPCPFLGFDRDQLGCYLVGRGALELAESQFRRAVWLNPFELSFRVHWALTLIKLERKPEAHDTLREVLAKNPEDKEALELWRQNWPEEQPVTPGSEVSP
jgi:tetratricopeptide (TPR) repeat protein